jgi:hypothetical protein
MVDVVCADCGKKVGVIEPRQGDYVVRHWSKDYQWAGAWRKAAKVAEHVPPRFLHGTDVLALERPDRTIWFDCPKHGRFGLTVADLRNAARGKSKRLPARR